jgi:hypothetical protein
MKNAYTILIGNSVEMTLFAISRQGWDSRVSGMEEQEQNSSGL